MQYWCVCRLRLRAAWDQTAPWRTHYLLCVLVVPPPRLQVATGCFRHLRQMFQELEETRPFELLKGQVGRNTREQGSLHSESVPP